MQPLSDELRQVMRQWTTGVAVVTTRAGQHTHGMTVNSFTSVSLEPPMITVTMAKDTRTFALVLESRMIGITVLRAGQEEISDRFAGRIGEDGDRFAGLETFSMASGAPLISGGLGYLDCKIVHQYEMQNSVLFVAEVIDARLENGAAPLIYHNREYYHGVVK